MDAEHFVDLLKEALKSEFAFLMGVGLSADDESWEKAARGIAQKMGVDEEDQASDGILLVGIELKRMETE